MIFAGGALSLLGALALGESSDATPIRIDLDAPADCATAEGFYEAVRERTERARTVKEGESGVRVVVRLTRVGQRVHGELRVIGERGESDTRRVDGSSCTEVVGALSLTVALAVDPTASLTPREQRTAAEPVTLAECPPPPKPPEPEPPPPPELEVHVGAHTDAMGQVSPFVSFGGDVSLRLVMPWAAASSFGIALVRVENDLFTTPKNAVVRSTLFELTACPKRFGDRASFTLEPCAVGFGGWLGAEGRGVASRAAAARSYFAFGGVLLATAPLAGGWDAELRLGAALPFVRRRFMLENPEREVAETPSIAGFGGVGATYTF